MISRLLLILTLLISFTTIQAQVKLSGKIVNAKNEPVSGVSIKVDGTNLGTQSDVDGRYILSLEQGKKYILTFSAINYIPKKVSDVEVGATLDNDLNVVLEAAEGNMEGVTVRTTSRKQENTASVLTFQKNNVALSSGIAADLIATLEG
ncbi:MAG: hypothetical protein EOO20_28720, partial [Chryseobacterium sp.]